MSPVTPHRPSSDAAPPKNLPVRFRLDQRTVRGSSLPAAQAQATLWVHEDASPIDWEVIAPPSAYTLFLLMDDARVMLRGASCETLERDCEAGAYCVGSPGEVVHVRCFGRCRAMRVVVPVHLLWSNDDAGRHGFSLHPARDALLLQLARAWLAIQHDGDGQLLAMSVLALLVQRLRQLRAQAVPCLAAARRTTLPHWRLRRVEDYVNTHLSEHVTLSDMASAAGLSPMHFAAQFRAATGCRPHHYLLLCRMDHAKQLMADSSRSMLDIALEVGFQTQSHFTTVFKRLVGKTPRQWRSEALSTYGSEYQASVG